MKFWYEYLPPDNNQDAVPRPNMAFLAIKIKLNLSHSNGLRSLVQLVQAADRFLKVKDYDKLVLYLCSYLISCLS
jgi:hypothetical protein